MALARRDPDGELVYHADRGSPYTSLEFTNRLADWNLSASYGSVGDAFDNAAMESFWATLKREIQHLHGGWEQLTRSEVRTVLFDYIEVLYNRQRHQARLGHHTELRPSTGRIHGWKEILNQLTIHYSDRSAAHN